MASQTRIAGTGENDASNGGLAAWTNFGNITADDNVRASHDNLNNGEITQLLKGTNFGFSIPSGATIDGIILEVEKYAVGGSTVDNVIKLVKADGSLGSTNKADTSTIWPAASPGSVISYGGATDLWGESWTDADINDADFGAVLAATNPGSNASSRVDFFRITVHYTEGGGATPVDGAALDLVWDARAEVTGAVHELVWDVRNSVDAGALDLLWDVAGPTPVDGDPLELVWDLTGTPSAGLSLRWDLEGDAPPADEQAAGGGRVFEVRRHEVEGPPLRLLWGSRPSAPAGSGALTELVPPEQAKPVVRAPRPTPRRKPKPRREERRAPVAVEAPAMRAERAVAVAVDGGPLALRWSSSEMALALALAARERGRAQSLETRVAELEEALRALTAVVDGKASQADVKATEARVAALVAEERDRAVAREAQLQDDVEVGVLLSDG